MRELGRRALAELLGEEDAYRILNGLDTDDDDDYWDREVREDTEPDPVLADFYGGISRRALASARDGLAAAKAGYDAAVLAAQAAGWTWPEIARVLGVSRQALHSRFRDRDPG